MPDEDEDPRRGLRTRTQGQRMLTAAKVEEEIIRISDAMEEMVNDYADLADAAARAEHAYKLKKAKEGLLASTRAGNGKDGRTTVDEREALVIVACDEELLAHLIADAHESSAKEVLRTQSNRLDGLRTIAANIRAAT